jgi:hypothetical protein
MKNLIFILIFLLSFLSNNTVFAVANKATYSEIQTIGNIPKQKKLSYLEKVLNRKIEKITKGKDDFKEKISKIARFIWFISLILLVLSPILLLFEGLNIWLIYGIGGFLLFLMLSSIFVIEILLGERFYGSC